MSVVGLLILDGWHIVEVAVKPVGVVPVHPAEGGEFDVVDGAPRSLVGSSDQFGLVQPVDRLRQSVDAPMCQDFGLGSLAGLPVAVVGENSLVDLAGDESFQAADDVAFGEPFGGAAGDVVDGGLVVLHTDDDRPVDRSVGLPVASPVEAVAVGHSR